MQEVVRVRVVGNPPGAKDGELPVARPARSRWRAARRASPRPAPPSSAGGTAPRPRPRCCARADSSSVQPKHPRPASRSSWPRARRSCGRRREFPVEQPGRGEGRWPRGAGMEPLHHGPPRRGRPGCRPAHPHVVEGRRLHLEAQEPARGLAASDDLLRIDSRVPHVLGVQAGDHVQLAGRGAPARRPVTVEVELQPVEQGAIGAEVRRVPLQHHAAWRRWSPAGTGPRPGTSRPPPSASPAWPAG